MTACLCTYKAPLFSMCTTTQKSWVTAVQRQPAVAAYFKVVVNCQNSRDKGPQNAIVPVGRPRPYSIIILNMRFIPEASLRASSQTTATSYIIERYLWVNNSKPFALAPTWSLGCKRTDCITAGMSKLFDPKLVQVLYWHPVNTKHLYDYTMLDQRRRRWADVG